MAWREDSNGRPLLCKFKDLFSLHKRIDYLAAVRSCLTEKIWEIEHPNKLDPNGFYSNVMGPAHFRQSDVDKMRAELLAEQATIKYMVPKNYLRQNTSAR